jgi:hypothetical protein
MLPHPQITPLPLDRPKATPALWNTRYLEIDQNFSYLDQRLDRRTGEALLINRAADKDLMVSPASSRVFSISPNRIHALGRWFVIGSQTGDFKIPPNPGTTLLYCFGRLVVAASTVRTETSELVATETLEEPPGTVNLVRFEVPANNGAIDLLKVRTLIRGNAAWPCMAEHAASAVVTFTPPLPSADYLVETELAGYAGSASQLGPIEISERTANGFKLRFLGEADAVRVRYVAVRY